MLAERSEYIWVDGEKTNYSVTDTGMVYSHSRVDNKGRLFKGRWLNPCYDKDGYRKITLNLGSRSKTKVVRIARLVAKAFIENPENKPFVNHIDGNKQNDHVSNLEWSTAKENTRHAWDTGLCTPYDRKSPYNRQGIIDSNKRRSKQSVESNRWPLDNVS